MAQNFSIHHNLIIKTSVQEVFEGITIPSQLNNWWPLKCSGEPKIGTEYNLNFTDEYELVWSCDRSKRK